jgi:hypothetical protein
VTRRPAAAQDRHPVRAGRREPQLEDESISMVTIRIPIAMEEGRIADHWACQVEKFGSRDGYEAFFRTGA